MVGNHQVSGCWQGVANCRLSVCRDPFPCTVCGARCCDAICLRRATMWTHGDRTDVQNRNPDGPPLPSLACPNSLAASELPPLRGSIEVPARCRKQPTENSRCCSMPTPQSSIDPCSGCFACMQRREGLALKPKHCSKQHTPNCVGGNAGYIHPCETPVGGDSASGLTA